MNLQHTVVAIVIVTIVIVTIVIVTIIIVTIDIVSRLTLQSLMQLLVLELALSLISSAHRYALV